MQDAMLARVNKEKERRQVEFVGKLSRNDVQSASTETIVVSKLVKVIGNLSVV